MRTWITRPSVGTIKVSEELVSTLDHRSIAPSSLPIQITFLETPVPVLQARERELEVSVDPFTGDGEIRCDGVPAKALAPIAAKETIASRQLAMDLMVIFIVFRIGLVGFVGLWWFMLVRMQDHPHAKKVTEMVVSPSFLHH